MSGTVLVPAINTAWVQMAKQIVTLFPNGSPGPGEVMEVRCFRDKRRGPRAFSATTARSSAMR